MCTLPHGVVSPSLGALPMPTLPLPPCLLAWPVEGHSP